MARIAEPGRAETILTAALEEFSENGYDRTRMNHIAQRASIASGTIYLYFESKEAIVKALAEEYHKRLNAALLPLFKEPATKANLKRIAIASLKFAVDDIDSLRLCGLVGYSSSETAEKFHTFLTTWLKEQMDTGYMKRTEPSALAQLLIGLVERAADSVVTRGERVEDYQAVLAHIYYGLLADN